MRAGPRSGMARGFRPRCSRKGALSLVGASVTALLLLRIRCARESTAFVHGPLVALHGGGHPKGTEAGSSSAGTTGVERRQAPLSAPEVGRVLATSVTRGLPPGPPPSGEAELEALEAVKPASRSASRSASEINPTTLAGLGIIGIGASQMRGGEMADEFGTWTQAIAGGLVDNHAPGLGGILEDGFMGMLTVVSIFCLFIMFTLKRKSSSMAGHLHTATGALQIVTVLWAILYERCFREAPGPIWALFTFSVYMLNNITMWPLLKYFRGQEVHRMLFKLAYSFIISFQGILAIAWSIQYPWLYWAVMPFWFLSLKKLCESSDNIFALLPDGSVPVPGVQEAARRRVNGIENDTPTLVYSILNFAGAIFDNCYMAAYTWRGPEGFWGWSVENIEGVNDHLRTALTKPAFCSLTISVLVFLGTLVHRKIISPQVALVLNIVLASVGPWLILYYHKLIDWSEPWQPEIMGDWGNHPYFMG